MKKLVILIAMFMIVGGASAATLTTDFSGGFTVIGADFDETHTTAGWQAVSTDWDATSGNAVLSYPDVHLGTPFNTFAQKFTDTRTGDYALEMTWAQVDTDTDLKTRVMVWGFSSATFNLEMDKIASDPTAGTFTLLLDSARGTLSGNQDHLAVAQNLGDVALDSSAYDYYVIRLGGAIYDADDTIQVNHVSIGGDSVGDATVGTVFTIK